MSIVLSPEVEQQIEELVRSGRFRSADDAIRTFIRDYRENQEVVREWLEANREEVDRKIEEGLRDLEEGRYTVYDDAGLKELMEEIKREGREGRARIASIVKPDAIIHASNL